MTGLKDRFNRGLLLFFVFFPVTLLIYFLKWERMENAEERLGKKQAGEEDGGGCS